MHNSKKLAGLIVGDLDGEDGDTTGEPPNPMGDELVDLADDLLMAIESKSAEHVADAFRAMLLKVETEPHEEFPGD